MSKTFLDTTADSKYLEKYDYVIGIDEAGRGPWAGSVAVAAYALSSNIAPINGVHDSKKLTQRERENIYNLLQEDDNYKIKLGSSSTIDAIGIAGTIEKLIQEIISEINHQYKGNKLFLIDGVFKQKFECNYLLIKKGDQTFYSIATASILAKVTRDKEMLDYSKFYPEYDFDKHKGYGTKLHYENLLKYGPCDIHRKSFRPISELV